MPSNSRFCWPQAWMLALASLPPLVLVRGKLDGVVVLVVGAADTNVAQAGMLDLVESCHPKYPGGCTFPRSPYATPLRRGCIEARGPVTGALTRPARQAAPRFALDGRPAAGYP